MGNFQMKTKTNLLGSWQSASLLLLCCAGPLGCVAATPPGPGAIGTLSQQRMGQQSTAASLALVRGACDAASQNPRDLRAQRKAIVLSTMWAQQHRKEPATTEVVQLVSPAIHTADVSAAACDARGEIGGLYDAVGEYGKAGDAYLRSAKLCKTYGATVMAAQSLRQVQRCPEVLDAVRGLWPKAPQTEWPTMLNAVNACSDAISLRQNLSFVPEAVRTSYLEELARQRREHEAQVAAAAAQAASDRRSSACRSDCYSAGSQCRSSCPSGQYYSSCAGRCSSAESMCRSQCH